MTETCQLIQIVSHSCKDSESMHDTLRQGLLDIAVYSQFIDGFRE